MVVFACYGGAAITVAAVCALAALAGRPPDHFTRDPLAVAELPFYIGLLSNLNALAWCAAATVCWFAAWILCGHGPHDRRAAMLAWLGAIITLLALDDLFMLHEELFQARLGVSERIVLMAYAAMALVFAAAFRRLLLRQTPLRLLPPVVALFALSIGVDQFTTGFGWRPVVEDSLKFLAVAGLLAYVVSAAAAWIGPRKAGEG